MSVSVYKILMEDFYYNTEKHHLISDVFNKPILLDQDFGSIWDAVLNSSTPGYLSIWKTIIVTLGWGKGVSGVCVCASGSVLEERFMRILPSWRRMSELEENEGERKKKERNRVEKKNWQG